MASKEKTNLIIRDRNSTLPDVDSHSVSKDDYAHTPDSPHKKMRSGWNTASLIALKAAVLRERQIGLPTLNGW